MAVKHNSVADGTFSATGTTNWNADHTVDDNTLVAAKLSATATDKLFGRSTAGAGAGEEITCTAAGRALIDDANAAAQRTTLGLGTAATSNTGDFEAAGAVATHEALADPHSQYALESALGTMSTQAANNVAITGGSITGITDLALADGGTGASLVDPNADRILFWDDSAGAVTWLEAGSGLSISGTTLSASGGTTIHGIFHARLTLESGVAVSSSDQNNKTTLYLTPMNGGQIGLYDGAAWGIHTLTEISAVVTGLTAAKNYDVFVYDNAGTKTLEFSAAWTNDTTRADALALQNGVWVKSGATTRRHVGTIRTYDNAGTVSTCETEGGTTTQVGGKRFVWNRYNQVPRQLKVHDTTDNWSYTTDTIRQAGAVGGNKIEYVTGDASTLVDAIVHGMVYLHSNSARAAKVGVGVDSTTAFSGFSQGGFNQDTTGLGGIPAGVYAPMFGRYTGHPGLGFHAINWCEKGADGTCTFLGDNGGDSQQAGMVVKVMM